MLLFAELIYCLLPFFEGLILAIYCLWRKSIVGVCIFFSVPFLLSFLSSFLPFSFLPFLFKFFFKLFDYLAPHPHFCNWKIPESTSHYRNSNLLGRAQTYEVFDIQMNLHQTWNPVMVINMGDRGETFLLVYQDPFPLSPPNRKWLLCQVHIQYLTAIVAIALRTGSVEWPMMSLAT